MTAKRLGDHIWDEIAHNEYGDNDPADTEGLVDGEKAVKSKK